MGVPRTFGTDCSLLPTCKSENNFAMLVLPLLALMISAVPQASFLGPLLFLIYIDDLLSYLNQGMVAVYTDDAVISHSSNCLSSQLGDLNKDIVNLQNRLVGNELSVNISKHSF